MVGPENLELNIYRARCALKCVLQGQIARAKVHCDLAPHWDVYPEVDDAGFKLDVVIRNFSFKLSQQRDGENEAVASNAVARARLSQMRSRDSGLFAAWRAQTHVSKLPALKYREAEVCEPRAMANVLGEHWGAIANEHLDIDTRLVEEVLAFTPQVAWLNAPVLDPSSVEAMLRAAPPSAPGPDGLRYVHLLSLGPRLFELGSALHEAWIMHGEWLDCFNESWVVPIPKLEGAVP